MNQARLQQMLDLQDRLNTIVNPGWKEAGNAWLLAIMMESAEAVDHYGWKWWKQQKPDLPQLRIELVDIWHFALSHAIAEYGSDAAQVIIEHLSSEYQKEGIVFDGGYYRFSDLSRVNKLRLMAGLAAAKRFSYALFENLLAEMDMGWDSLYRTYIGKNVLNIFRQDHGYKDGTYVKVWDGLEDNVHLDLLLKGGIDDPQQLYTALERVYQTLPKAA